MKIHKKVRGEKLQYDINREGGKTLALSSGEIDKYEYLTDEKMLPSHHSKIIEQGKFTYSPLGRAFEKQRKTIRSRNKKS